jgi:hypothetical protein
VEQLFAASDASAAYDALVNAERSVLPKPAGQPGAPASWRVP